ncbi:MAG TPA: response regulator, partial [Gemmatimonadales bacterium]|nr:response regulator [Gemmatimonadales bacterium]
MPGNPVRPTAVLIVDDEKPMRHALQRFLKGLDLPTLTAASGAEALEVLRASPVALMLADIRMPGMSGIDLVPQALALDPDLAVVMLSAV